MAMQNQSEGLGSAYIRNNHTLQQERFGITSIRMALCSGIVMLHGVCVVAVLIVLLHA